MFLKAVLLFFAALGTACVQTAPNDNVSAAPADNSTVANTAANTESNANECRICDYDFASYKGELKKGEVEGLLLALNDEYLAIAIYQDVNKKFGSSRPFSNIIRAEERHAEQLIGLFKQYKIPVPENPWTDKVPEFESVKAACEAGIEGEVVNIELYDKLFESTKREDILFIYKNLRRASEENHKPAFERCAGGGGKGMGRGRGRRN